MDINELIHRLREARQQAGGRPVEVEIQPHDSPVSRLIEGISYEPAPVAYLGDQYTPKQPRIIITCKHHH